MIGRLPLNGWFHDRMIWLPTGMAVSIGANGALSTRTKSTSDRVSVSEMSPTLALETVSVNDRVSNSGMSAALEMVSVRDSVSESEMSAALEMVSVSDSVSESETLVVPSIVAT